MVQAKVVVLWGLLSCAADLLLALNGCGSGTTTTTNSTAKIQHVVVIFQENRTPDNLFHDQVLIQRGADIQTYGVNSKGEHITLTPGPLRTNYDLNHDHSSFLKMYDGGKMDGADLIPVGCPAPCNPPPPPHPQFQYVNASNVQPYFMLAETYTFGDRMFQSNQGPSFPAHQFIISGSSAPSAPGNPNSDLLAADGPYGGGLARPGDKTGCIAPPGEYVQLIDPANLDPRTNETQQSYPCFDHPTLTDLLDSHHVNWRYYTPNAGTLWNGPNAIQHICGPNAQPPNATACAGSIWQQHVVMNSTQVLTDIQNGQLASVSWVIPSGITSDHAELTDGSGPSWVASVVNAIGNSSYWANTAIIITWDDWGGWYDHVPPTAIINSYEYGFRVPLIVVSPYAKPAHVSHQVNDFGSILKFIERTFGLPLVAPGASPAYVDALKGTADLSDCFDFKQAPLTFRTIPAPMDAGFFLSDTRPQTDPDND